MQKKIHPVTEREKNARAAEQLARLERQYGTDDSEPLLTREEARARTALLMADLDRMFQ